MSEKGYWNPTQGYWQTTDEPSAEVLASYPIGTVEVPIKPGEFFEWDGTQWVDNTPPPLTSAEKDQIASDIADEVMSASQDYSRAIAEVVAEVIWRVSNGNVPQNVTQAQARTWVRDTLRDKYRELIE